MRWKRQYSRRMRLQPLIRKLERMVTNCCRLGFHRPAGILPEKCPSFKKIAHRPIWVRCTVAIKPEARRQIYWTMVLIDTFVINRRDERVLVRKTCRYVRRAGVIFDDQYERPIAHSRGGVHPRVLECCKERTEMENELSRVVNPVATASLIENRIDG